MGRESEFLSEEENCAESSAEDTPLLYRLEISTRLCFLSLTTIPINFVYRLEFGRFAMIRAR